MNVLLTLMCFVGAAADSNVDVIDLTQDSDSDSLIPSKATSNYSPVLSSSDESSSESDDTSR